MTSINYSELTWFQLFNGSEPIDLDTQSAGRKFQYQDNGVLYIPSILRLDNFANAHMLASCVLIYPGLDLIDSRPIIARSNFQALDMAATRSGWTVQESPHDFGIIQVQCREVDIETFGVIFNALIKKTR